MGQAAEQSDLTTNFLLSGVGGQGTLLAADVVALVGIELGLEAKKSEIHGMAQRGGSVVSQVRWGRRVHSPIIRAGGADVLVAFERLEALRYADQIRPGGILLVNDYAIVPISVTSGNGTYPTSEQESAVYAGHFRVYRIPSGVRMVK